MTGRRAAEPPARQAPSTAAQVHRRAGPEPTARAHRRLAAAHVSLRGQGRERQRRRVGAPASQDARGDAGARRGDAARHEDAAARARRRRDVASPSAAAAARAAWCTRQHSVVRVALAQSFTRALTSASGCACRVVAQLQDSVIPKLRSVVHIRHARREVPSFSVRPDAHKVSAIHTRRARRSEAFSVPPDSCLGARLWPEEALQLGDEPRRSVPAPGGMPAARYRAEVAALLVHLRSRVFLRPSASREGSGCTYGICVDCHLAQAGSVDQLQHLAQVCTNQTLFRLASKRIVEGPRVTYTAGSIGSLLRR